MTQKYNPGFQLVISRPPWNQLMKCQELSNFDKICGKWYVLHIFNMCLKKDMGSVHNMGKGTLFQNDLNDNINSLECLYVKTAKAWWTRKFTPYYGLKTVKENMQINGVKPWLLITMFMSSSGKQSGIIKIKAPLIYLNKQLKFWSALLKDCPLFHIERMHWSRVQGSREMLKAKIKSSKNNRVTFWILESSTFFL